MLNTTRFFVILGAIALLAPLSATAQGHGGVARSGMGQGEARISSRSDVRLSMESMPGTSGASVSALGTRVGAQMATIRGCYETTVGENPSVVGTLRLRILIEGRGGPAIEVDRDGVGDAGLVRCITRALGAVNASGITRPTRAIVQLEMGNSAAAGAEQARERAQEAQQVTITIDGDGNATSSGQARGRGVSFTVVGQGRESAPAVVAAHRAVLEALPGLLDCHRRAGRQRQSPEGDLRVQMQIREGRPPAARVSHCTVEESRTRPCVQRVLRAVTRRSDGGSGNVEVRIHFEDRQDVGE